MSNRMLEREEELDLLARWRDGGDQDAITRIIESHMPLIHGIAKKYKGYARSYDDLVQEGTIGLMHAISKFDPSRGVRLNSYARSWIESAISDFVVTDFSSVRITCTAKNKKLFMMIGRGGLMPGQAETIASETGVDTDYIERMAGRMQSFDANILLGDNGPDYDGDQRRYDVFDELEDPAPTPEEAVAEDQRGERMAELAGAALDVLDAQEREIIRRRYMADKKESLQDIADSLGLSREWVRQIELDALERMKRAVLSAMT